VLVYGGSAEDRRTWAENAALNFASDGPLAEVSPSLSLTSALALRRGVVYVEDAARLPRAEQLRLVHALFRQEERPKVILGVAKPPEQLVGAGVLRDDLFYRLSQAIVDVGDPKVQAALKTKRRAQEPGPAAPGKSRGAERSIAARAPKPKRSRR
jgi:hypothetical protein